MFLKKIILALSVAGLSIFGQTINLQGDIINFRSGSADYAKLTTM